MSPFMRQEEVMVSDKPTNAVPTGFACTKGTAFYEKDIFGDVCSGQGILAPQVDNNTDPAQEQKRDELYEDMQALFKDEEGAFRELEELQELQELDAIHESGGLLEVDGLLEPSDHLDEYLPEFISNSREFEVLNPSQRKIKQPVKVPPRSEQTSRRPEQALRPLDHAKQRVVQTPQRTEQALQRLEQILQGPEQAKLRPEQRIRRPEQEPQGSEQVLGHLHQAPRSLKQSPPRPEKAFSLPRQAPPRPGLELSRPGQAPGRPKQAQPRRMQAPSIETVTPEQILDFLSQPPTPNVSRRDMRAPRTTEGHSASNPIVLQQTPRFIVNPSNVNAPTLVNGYLVPKSRGMQNPKNVMFSQRNMTVPPPVNGHPVPNSRVLQQTHIPVTSNINGSHVVVDPRVANQRVPRYQNMCHTANGLESEAAILQNHNVPVATATPRARVQERPQIQAIRMNPNQMQGLSTCKRKIQTQMPQGHPTPTRKRVRDVNGAPLIPGTVPGNVHQTPGQAIPFQQNGVQVRRDNVAPTLQGNHVQLMGYEMNRGINPIQVQRNPMQQNGNPSRAAQMLPPKPRRRAAALPPGARKPPRQPRRGNAAQGAAKRKAQTTANGTERPKKRTRTRIEDLDPANVHVCDYAGCTKKFAKKYNLKIHQRRHNGDLPFTCEYNGCAKRFMWLSSFSRHMRVHKSKKTGGRKKRESQEEAQQGDDVIPAQESDIAIAENYSVFGVARVQHLVENEKAEEVTLAYAMTALDEKPCQKLVPASKNAQMQRQNYLCGARAEEFYQYLTTPYDANNPQLQAFCQVLAAASDTERYLNNTNVLI